MKDHAAAQTQHYYYDRATKEKIPVSDEVYAVLSGEASRVRMKEQYHRRCMCPKQFIWKCDGCCQDCEYHAAGDVLSLYVPGEDGDSCMYDSIADDRQQRDHQSDKKTDA